MLQFPTRKRCLEQIYKLLIDQHQSPALCKTALLGLEMSSQNPGPLFSSLHLFGGLKSEWNRKTAGGLFLSRRMFIHTADPN